jgi:hypothetical protein
VAERIDLDHQAERNAVDFAQFDEPVEDRLPFSVAGEIIVGQEEAGNSFRPVFANDVLDVVGRARARFAALDIDDGAERALVRAAAAGIEARIGAGGALDILDWQKRARLSRHIDQIVGEVVVRLEAAAGRFLQQRFKPAFRLAGKNTHAKLAGAIEIDGRAVEHGDAAGDVKAADDDGNAGGAERPRDVERARILVGLHTDQPDHAESTSFAETAQQFRDIHAGIGFVDNVDVDIDVVAEHAALRAIERHAVERGQRIRRHKPAPPADDVAVIVIVRRFDEHDAETTPGPRRRLEMCHGPPAATLHGRGDRGER